MFAGASLDENSGAFCELKANFFRLILTKAELLALTYNDINLEEKTISFILLSVFLVFCSLGLG